MFGYGSDDTNTSMLSLWKIIVKLGAKSCKCQMDKFGQMSGEKQDPEGQASLNIISIQS